MNNLFNRLFYVCAVFLMLMPLISCGGGGGGGAGTGTLSLGLTDATTDQYQAIYVTIDEVQVKKQGEGEEESGWLTVFDQSQTFNLLELVNGIIADLGIAELEAGQYGQMRLILGKQADDSLNILDKTHDHPNYLIKNDTENTIVPLKVPSGFKTGIKIVKGFTIEVDGFTELILDFDALKSVVQAGNSGQWLLKPTIKVIETARYAVVSGTVTEESVTVTEEATEEEAAEENPVWLGDAMVSAQIYTPPPDPLDGWDPKDEVTVAGATVSDILGDYFMYLPPNTYNIVATKADYVPQCQVVAATEYSDYTANNFILAGADTTGTFSASVSGLDTAEDFALFSIRLAHGDCGVIEVASFSVAEGATSDPITLPAGTSYTVVVSAVGETTQVIVSPESDVVADTDTLLNIVFPTP